jgi:hypothetical protein
MRKNVIEGRISILVRGNTSLTIIALTAVRSITQTVQSPTLRASFGSHVVASGNFLLAGSQNEAAI